MFIVILNLFACEKTDFVVSVATVLSSLIKPLKTKLNSLCCSICTVYESPHYATIPQLPIAGITESPSYHVVLLTSFVEERGKEKYLGKG